MAIRRRNNSRSEPFRSSDVRLEQIAQPGGPGSFFKCHVQTAEQAANKLENRLGFRFELPSHDSRAKGPPK
jgi:hypothetical protein